MKIDSSLDSAEIEGTIANADGARVLGARKRESRSRRRLRCSRVLLMSIPLFSPALSPGSSLFSVSSKSTTLAGFTASRPTDLSLNFSLFKYRFESISNILD